MIRFSKIIDVGGGPIVEFECSLYYDDQGRLQSTFRSNLESLETRIENLRRQNLDVSQELIALDSLKCALRNRQTT